MRNRHIAIAAGLVASLGLSAAAPLVAAAVVPRLPTASSTDTPDRLRDTHEGADAERADAPVNAKAITLIENATEAIAEAETTGARATAAANGAIGMWAGARQKLAENGASERQLASAAASIVRLRQAVATHVDLRRSANDVTGALAPLFAFSGDGTPAAIHTLDYLGRSIGLDVVDANWARVASDTARLRATWNGVRPRVMGRKEGPLAAARFERVVATLERAARARDASGTTVAAKHSLDGVDALEKTFGA